MNIEIVHPWLKQIYAKLITCKSAAVIDINNQGVVSVDSSLVVSLINISVHEHLSSQFGFMVGLNSASFWSTEETYATLHIHTLNPLSQLRQWTRTCVRKLLLPLPFCLLSQFAAFSFPSIPKHNETGFYCRGIRKMADISQETRKHASAEKVGPISWSSWPKGLFSPFFPAWLSLPLLLFERQQLIRLWGKIAQNFFTFAFLFPPPFG